MLSPAAELANLYRRTDGTLRQCRHGYTTLCLQKYCNAYGCHLALEILRKHAGEAVP